MTDVNLSLPDKKTTAFLVSGIALYLGSAYINTLKDSSADSGIYLSITIIAISVFAQFINWMIYWLK